MSDPWDLLMAGEYAAAIDAYSGQIAADTGAPAHNNRATAYMLAGQLDAALGDFAVAGYLGFAGPTRSDYAHLHVGAVLWLKGRYPVAASLWECAVREMLKNRFTHTDAAGGVRCGCLLWFASTRLRDAGLRALAEELLSKRLRKPGRWDRSWPAPLAAMLLGDASPCHVVDIASSPPSLAFRQLCQAHFYAAATALSRDDDNGTAVAHLRSAADTGAFIELEYFLARYELGQASPGIGSEP